MLLLTTFLLVLLPIATAIPANANASSSHGLDLQWVRFCNDKDCSQGCGSWVDVQNAGCLNNQAGRLSIQWQNAWAQIPVSLLFTPGSGCTCQAQCMYFEQGPSSMCTVIPKRSGDAGSYRFIGGHCDDNNCQWPGVCGAFRCNADV